MCTPTLWTLRGGPACAPSECTAVLLAGQFIDIDAVVASFGQERVASEQVANRVAVLCSDDGVTVQARRRARGRRVGGDDEAGGHRRASVDERVAEALKPLWP